ncbi:MAG: cytochrome c oxidase subunit 3 family protein [Rhodothermales bacterium]|nr:cytochrome c oxidase subunit 3 family protein [Rhodothermales bacterium]
MASSSSPAHADSHPAHLQHHFVSSEQQFDAAKMGMWLFLVTEILLFAGMFVAYTVYRVWYPEVFVQSSTLLNPWLGGLNTLVLLGSSFTVALSIHFIQNDNRKGLIINLALTMAAAIAFLVVKYFEYTHKFHLGVFPGEHYSYSEVAGPYVAQFFSIYYIMTGIHGLHVIIGIGLFIWLTVRATKGHFSSAWYTPVELVGLYWHIVDIIWIFLFPLLYLI